MPRLSTFSERRHPFLWNFITSARISTKISSVKYESDALGVLEEVVIDEAILYVESIRVHCLGHWTSDGDKYCIIWSFKGPDNENTASLKAPFDFELIRVFRRIVAESWLCYWTSLSHRMFSKKRLFLYLSSCSCCLKAFITTGSSSLRRCLEFSKLGNRSCY